MELQREELEKLYADTFKGIQTGKIIKGKVIQVKEIKIRPKIGEHDYQTKIKRAIEFLQDGKRVKVTLFFRGRENITKEVRGPELFQKVEDSFREQGFSSLIHEHDSQMGQVWSRTYYLKSAK